MSIAKHGHSAETAQKSQFSAEENKTQNFDEFLTSLDLAWSELGHKGAEKLCIALNGTKSLRSLNLRSAKIFDDGTKSIAALLCNCRELTFLDLGWNEIQDNGAESLGELLARRHLKKLRTLDLTGNWLSSAAIRKLATGIESCESLERLELSNNDIGDDGATRLGWMLGRSETITKLGVSGNRFGPEGLEHLCEGAGRASALIHLDLSANRLGMGQLRPLRGLIQSKTLRTINLARTKLHSEDMRHIAELYRRSRSATELLLGQNLHIGSEGAKLLGAGLLVSGRAQLTHLDLQGCGISDAGAAPLFLALAGSPAMAAQPSFSAAMSRYSALTHVTLRSNQIALAMPTIAEALRGCPDLAALDVADNKIDDDGAESVARGLLRWTRLARLDLGDNLVGERGGRALARALPESAQLEHLDVGGNVVGARVKASIRARFRGKTLVLF